MCYRWLHKRACDFYYRLNVLLTYLIVFIGIFNAITTFVCNTYYSNHDNLKNLETFFVSSSSLAISAIAQLQRKARFYEKSENHHMFSRQFEEFNRKIRHDTMFIEMTNDKLKEIIAEYDDLANSSPYIPDQVISEFDSKYGNLLIWKPNAFYGLEDVKNRKSDRSQTSDSVSVLKRAFYAWIHRTHFDHSTNV